MTAISPALEHADAKVGRIRAITPRRSLPNGRALLGALLITIAAVGAYVASTGGSESPTSKYLVLTAWVGAGQPIGSTDAMLAIMDIPPEVSRSALSSTAGLTGAIALRDLRPGEILSTEDLLAAPMLDGKPIGSVHEISFPVPLDRTPSGLLRGDRVTILSTLRIADQPTTVVALEDALVISFNPRSDQLGATGTGILTLAIPDANLIVSTAHLAQLGDLTIIRSTRALQDSYPESYSVSQSLALDSPVGQ